MTAIFKRIDRRMEMLTASELHYWAGAGALILALLALWRRLHIRAGISWVWQKTGGRDHHKIFGALDRLEQTLEDVLGPANGHGTIQDQLVGITHIAENSYAMNSARLKADPRAIFITDADGRVIGNSRKHTHMLGYSLEQLQGDGWINVIHPTMQDEIARKWERCIEKDIEFSGKILYQHPEKPDYWIHLEVFRQVDSKGKLKGYMGIVELCCEECTEQEARERGCDAPR